MAYEIEHLQHTNDALNKLNQFLMQQLNESGAYSSQLKELLALVKKLGKG